MVDGVLLFCVASTVVCFAGLGVINRFCIKLIDVARTLRRKGICLPRHPCVSYSLHALIRSGSSATRHPKGRGGVDTARTLRRKRICLPRRPCVSYSLHALIRSGSSATRHPKDGWLRQAPGYGAFFSNMAIGIYRLSFCMQGTKKKP